MHDIPLHLTPRIKRPDTLNNYANTLSYRNPPGTSHRILLWNIQTQSYTDNIGNQCALKRILQPPLTFMGACSGMWGILFLAFVCLNHILWFKKNWYKTQFVQPPLLKVVTEYWACIPYGVCTHRGIIKTQLWGKLRCRTKSVLKACL